MQLAAMESHTPTSHLAGIISLCQVRCLGSINAMPPLGLVHSFRQGLPNKQLSNMGSRHLSLVLWSTCLLLLSTDAGTGARNRQSLRTGPLPEAESATSSPGVRCLSMLTPSAVVCRPCQHPPRCAAGDGHPLSQPPRPLVSHPVQQAAAGREDDLWHQGGHQLHLPRHRHWWLGVGHPEHPVTRGQGEARGEAIMSCSGSWMGRAAFQGGGRAPCRAPLREALAPPQSQEL